MIINYISQNRILIEIIYTLLVIFPCFFVFLKTCKIYRFSHHTGLRYFNLAFLFFTIAFLFRFGTIYYSIYMTADALGTIATTGLIRFILEFLTIIPGIFLLYSMLWKNFEKSNLFSKIRMPFLVTLALIISAIDVYRGSFLFMYVTQIVIFSYASLVSFANYHNSKLSSKNKKNYKKMFFLSMFLFLIVWIVNFIAQYTIDRYPILRIYAYFITVVICYLFLYITHNITRHF